MDIQFFYILRHITQNNSFIIHNITMWVVVKEENIRTNLFSINGSLQQAKQHPQCAIGFYTSFVHFF